MRPALVLALLLAVPALAAEPFQPGDVAATVWGVECGPHFSCSGLAVYLHRGAQLIDYIGPANFRYPTPTGTITYSPALNRMVLVAFGISTMTLEAMDSDGRTTLFAELPPGAMATALAGIGDDLLVAVTQISPYKQELWRISAISGAVTQRIELPQSARNIVSIDLAGDRCTLAYAVRGEAVHRFDLCTQKPLADATARPASAVHFAPGGNLLVFESPVFGDSAWPRLALYDRSGRLLSSADLPWSYGEPSGSIAVDPAGSAAWVAPAFGKGLMASIAGGALTGREWAQSGNGVAVAGEWRAAEQQGSGRGRAARH